MCQLHVQVVDAPIPRVSCIYIYDYTSIIRYLINITIYIILVYYSPNRFHLRGSGGFVREPLVILPFRRGGCRIDFVARRGTC